MLMMLLSRYRILVLPADVRSLMELSSLECHLSNSRNIQYIDIKLLK